jgi:hypothetical protein
VVVEGEAVAIEQQEKLGHPAVVLSRTLSRLSTRMTLKTRKPSRLCQPRNPRSPRSTSTVFDCVGYAPSLLLDARQGQPSTESLGGTSKHVGFLGQRRRLANVNATAALRTIFSRLGPTGRKGYYASSPHAL